MFKGAIATAKNIAEGPLLFRKHYGIIVLFQRGKGPREGLERKPKRKEG